MSDDPRQKMKTILQKVGRILSSPITIGIGLSGLILWYLLFGSCGYVTVKSSIKDMNKILNDWQELRGAAIPVLAKNGEVGFETIIAMQGLKNLAYELEVPSCLNEARSNLIDAIESDYQTFHLAKDRITIDKKLEFLSSNIPFFVRYQQRVDLIEACAPICNAAAALPDLLDP